MPNETNWAGNYTYRAAAIHRPESIDEVRQVVRAASRIRALGTRHTFNDIADTGELVSLERLPQDVVIDKAARTVTISAAMRYGHLNPILHERGYALHNTGSLPHICVGGATATATHGSGDANRNLASAVVGLEFVTADGEIIATRRGEPEFEGMVVHLGALGIVTRLTLEIQPTFQVAQEVIAELPWEDLLADFDGIFGGAYSVSVFPDWRQHADTLWIKHRLAEGQEPVSGHRWGGRAETADRHPIGGLRSDYATEQRLIPGPWHLRLPHFVMDGLPSAGEEIQVEYMVSREHALDVIHLLRDLEPHFHDLILIGEIRTVTADDLWMSTAYQRETVCFHFTMKRNPSVVDKVIPVLERELAPFAPRPHWGKAFVATAAELRPRYPRFDDFIALANRLDPAGKFRNAYLDRAVFG